MKIYFELEGYLCLICLFFHFHCIWLTYCDFYDDASYICESAY